MPADEGNPKSTEAIRRRSAELVLSRGHNTADAELLAAIADGTLSFDQVDEDTLRRHIETFGADSVVDAFLCAGSESRAVEEKGYQGDRGAIGAEVTEKSMLQFPRKLGSIGGWWNNPLSWSAAAAAVVLVGVLAFRTTSTVPPPQRTIADGSFALRWPAQPPFEPSAMKEWQLPATPLPREMPDFHNGASTLGPSGKDWLTPWRLATVIVQSDKGWGSGAFISSDGWILSTYHVVAVSAQEAAATGRRVSFDIITAGIIDGRPEPQTPLKATLFRADPVHDLALLKLDSFPARRKPLSYFQIGHGVQNGETCFVIGSQSRSLKDSGQTWLVRSGNVLHVFDYPEGLAQFSKHTTETTAAPVRERFTVIATDTGTSPGDSGGPLLNSKGELIGLTFVPPANSRDRSMSWHIALPDLRSFVSTFPTHQEGLPFDPWTAGLPDADILEPELSRIDYHGPIDALRYFYANATQNGMRQPAALTTFVDLKGRATRGNDPGDLVPYGLWNMETRGQFRFNLYVTLRADHLTAVGYTNDAGIVNEIRLGSNSQDASAIWRRNLDGTWVASEPSRSTPLLDSSRFSENDWNRLKMILNRVLNLPDIRFSGKQPPADHN